jgi:hypothetical protein
MTFDEVMDTWRTQEKSPAYNVNRDLLQLVLQNEQAPMRRNFRAEAWLLYFCYTLFFVGAVLFFLTIFMQRHYGDEPRQFWGYFVAAAAAALSLGSGIAHWLSRRRQAQRERSFGNTLRAELQRHISLLDYALSRKGQALRSFMTSAPLGAAAVMFTLLSAVVNGLPINPMRILRKALFIAGFFFLIASVESRSIVKKLQPRRERLVALLRELDAVDGRSTN